MNEASGGLTRREVLQGLGGGARRRYQTLADSIYDDLGLEWKTS